MERDLVPGGPGWDEALELYRSVLVQSLRGLGPRNDNPQWRAANQQLHTKLRTLWQVDMITCGLWLTFERWAKQQLGWADSIEPPYTGLMPPGFAHQCAAQRALYQELTCAERPELSVMLTLCEQEQQYYQQLASRISALS